MKVILSRVVFLSSVVLLVGCATGHKIEGARGIAPAAQAEIVTKSDKHGNTQLDISVAHLAAPEKIREGATSYVIWIVPTGESKLINVGGFSVNKNLEAKYKTTVPYAAFNMRITAEERSDVVVPTGVTVLEKLIE